MENNKELTTIQITKETLNKLAIMKYKLKLQTYDSVILELLDNMKEEVKRE